MKLKRTIKHIWNYVGGNIIAVALFVIIAVLFLNGLRQASASSKNESARIATESIMRAVVSCYAVEGRYPESYEYLKENYGVSVDEKKYIVHYDIFASNIMPDISVIERSANETISFS